MVSFLRCGMDVDFSCWQQTFFLPLPCCLNAIDLTEIHCAFLFSVTRGYARAPLLWVSRWRKMKHLSVNNAQTAGSFVCLTGGDD